MAHIDNGILLSHKKEWNNAICSNMDGPGDYHTKWSKSEKDKYITYMYNLKKWYKWTYLQNRNRLRDIENNVPLVTNPPLVTKGDGREER